jgi:hypothetical protein
MKILFALLISLNANALPMTLKWDHVEPPATDSFRLYYWTKGASSNQQYIDLGKPAVKQTASPNYTLPIASDAWVAGVEYCFQLVAAKVDGPARSESTKSNALCKLFKAPSPNSPFFINVGD